jgi:alanyl-tRNA synthetase
MPEENEGTTVEGSQNEPKVNMEDVLKRLEILENERKAQDKSISRLVNEKKDLEAKAKELETSKMTEAEKMQLQLSELNNKFIEQERLTRVANNRASAIQTFEKESLPSELIDFVRLDDGEVMTGQIEKLKAIVDGVRSKEKDLFARGNGDKVATGSKIGDLTGKSAKDFTADEMNELYRKDPEAARALLNRRK